MKILLAFDGSPHSHTALTAVAARPWPPGSTIKLLTVIELAFSPMPNTKLLPDSYYAKFEREVRRAAQEALHAAAEQLRANAVTTNLCVLTEIQMGEARQAILAEAGRWEADWIVLGCHGYPGWTKRWLGSVPYSVGLHAPCSVAIVRLAENKGSA